MTEGKIGIRLKILAGLMVFMFGALATRLWFVQVLATERYIKEAHQNAIRVVAEQPPRGRIFDRNGRLLVGNRLSLEVTVNRQALGDKEESVLYRLSRLLRMPVADLVERLKSKRYFQYTPVPVAFDVPKKVAFYIGEHANELRGVAYERVPVRTYPQGKLAAHILGYTGEISEEQLTDPSFHGYDPQDIVGRAGLEETYEHQLQGTKGEHKYKVNAAGKNLGEIGRGIPPVPGKDVVLSLDLRVQRLAENSLHLGMAAARHVFDEGSGIHLRAGAGAVVVIKPHSGQVLAIASAPNYDPRIWVGGIPEKTFERLNTTALNHPLLDRAIQADYPPGSTFKPFVALSALQRDLISLRTNLDCPARYEIPGIVGPDRFKNNWASYDQGYMPLSEALVRSCDTFFYQLGWDFWVRYAHSGPGTSDLDNYRDRELNLQPDLETFGFGRPDGVDVPSEHGGRIPDPEWKATVHLEDPEVFPEGLWLPGDYFNMTIGQGDVLVTPLQLAVGFAAIANGGQVMRPHLGLRIERPDGTVVRRIKPEVEGRLPFRKKYLNYVRESLIGVVTSSSGTAYAAFVGFPFEEVPVAAKTGTAEVAPHQPYSWFAAMAPAYDPQYVVVALVEEGGHGSQTAAPIVRRILEGLFHIPRTPIYVPGPQD